MPLTKAEVVEVVQCLTDAHVLLMDVCAGCHIFPDNGAPRRTEVIRYAREIIAKDIGQPAEYPFDALNIK